MSLTERRVVAVVGAGCLIYWVVVLVDGGWSDIGRLEVLLPLGAVACFGIVRAVRDDGESAAHEPLEARTEVDGDSESAPPSFTRPVAGAPEGGAVITPMGDYELRVQDDELAALILPPRGSRAHLRILTGDGSWRVRPIGGNWNFVARREQDREPVVVFERRPLRASGRLTLSGGTRLDLRRRIRRRDWTLRAGDRELLVLSAPRDRHREQIMRFQRLDECPLAALLVPFALWIAVEIDRQDRRLWRDSRRDDPDRLPGGWWGDGGGGDGGGGGGDGGGGGG